MSVPVETTNWVPRDARSAPLRSSIRRPPVRHHIRHGAFSLAETLISVILVGGLMVVALNTAGASLTTRKNMSSRGVAQLLAQELMTEIVQQTYLEPTDPPIFGREAGELATSRDLYDDVDDYDAWTASPPQNKDGTVIAGMTGWQRTVEVVWVRTNNLRLESASGEDSGVKRITVSVFDNNDVQVASLCGARTNSAATTAPSVKTAIDPTPLPPPVLVE